MNQNTLIVILAIVLLCTIIYLIILNQQKTKLKLDLKYVSQPSEELINYQNAIFELKINYERQLNDLRVNFEKDKNFLRENLRKEKDVEYQRGYDLGIKSSSISVQVMPYKEVIKDDKFFFKEDIVKIGYKYQLFSNGIPCFDAHIEISEKIHLKEIKEENIKIAISKIEEIISKIPNPNIQMVGSMKDFSKGLLNLKNNKN